MPLNESDKFGEEGAKVLEALLDVQVLVKGYLQGDLRKAATLQALRCYDIKV